MENKEIKDALDALGKQWNDMQPLIKAANDEQKRIGTVLGDTAQQLKAFNDRLDSIEVKLQRPGSGGKEGSPEAAATKAAFLSYARKGVMALSPEERKLLTVTDDTTGGFRAPAEFDSEIIKGIIEISPVRGLVTVRTTSKRSIKVMKRTGTFAARWVGETQTRTETTGLAYGLEEIPNHEIYALVDVSVQDLEDTDFDLEGEIKSEATDQFALAEGDAVISGDGNGKPSGFLVNSAVPNENTGDANNLTYNGLVAVSHNGKADYMVNGVFVLSLSTLGKIRMMVDGAGNPLWAPMASGAPSTILGRPYTILQGMPSVANTNKAIAFGNFKRAYRMVDRIGIGVVRDDLTQATSGAVRFLLRKRVGGQVVVAEAIRTLTVSA